MAHPPQAGDALSPYRRARQLEWLTVAWNAIEAAVAIGTGIAAGSVALMGFGLDSVIETVSAGVVIWRLRAPDERAQVAERRAARAVGVTLLLVAAYIVYESGARLLHREPPAPSLAGIALAAVALLAMLWLSHAKRRIARQIGSRALAADAAETLVCAWLSAALLIGLGLNALFGWWWADPAAALLMLPLIVKEALEAFEGECEHEDDEEE